MHRFLYLVVAAGLLPASYAATCLAPAPSAAVASATYPITGRVTDRATGQGLPGVTVLVKGATIGVST